MQNRGDTSQQHNISIGGVQCLVWVRDLCLPTQRSGDHFINISHGAKFQLEYRGTDLLFHSNYSQLNFYIQASLKCSSCELNEELQHHFGALTGKLFGSNKCMFVQSWDSGGRKKWFTAIGKPIISLGSTFNQFTRHGGRRMLAHKVTRRHLNEDAM